MSGGFDCGVFPASTAALYIRISHPEALPDLVSALSKRVHYVARTVAPDAVAISVLGSFSDGGKGDLRDFLRDWTACRPGIKAEVKMEDLRAVTVLPIPLPRADINDRRILST